MLAISWVIFIDLQGGSGSNKLLLCDNLLLATKAVISRRDPAAFSCNCIVINHQSPGAAPQHTPVWLLFLTTATANKAWLQWGEEKSTGYTRAISPFALRVRLFRSVPIMLLHLNSLPSLGVHFVVKCCCFFHRRSWTAVMSFDYHKMLTISYVPWRLHILTQLLHPHGFTGLAMPLIHHMVSHYTASMKGSLLALQHPASAPQIMLKPNRREMEETPVFHAERIVCLKCSNQYCGGKIRLKGFFFFFSREEVVNLMLGK